jgi:hypothetical protein
MRRKSSKKSIREHSKSPSSGKHSSPAELSFVSRISLFSSEEGQYVKNAIEKELFDNELGPYQSALYSLLDLIEHYPKSGTVYTVGQRTLDDRIKVEQRKKIQQTDIAEYTRKIERLERKKSMWNSNSEEDQIKRNKL